MTMTEICTKTSFTHNAFVTLKSKGKKRKRPVKKEKILKDEQGNDIGSPRLSDNPSEEGEVKVRPELTSVAS